MKFVFFLLAGLVSGLLLGQSCPSRSDIDSGGKAGEKSLIEMSTEILVTKKEIIRHKACLKATKTQAKFKVCVDKN